MNLRHQRLEQFTVGWAGALADHRMTMRRSNQWLQIGFTQSSCHWQFPSLEVMANDLRYADRGGCECRML
jgi:hypothetical protein